MPTTRILGKRAGLPFPIADPIRKRVRQTLVLGMRVRVFDNSPKADDNKDVSKDEIIASPTFNLIRYPKCFEARKICAGVLRELRKSCASVTPQIGKPPPIPIGTILALRLQAESRMCAFVARSTKHTQQEKSMKFKAIKLLTLATLLAVAVSSATAQDNNDRPRRNRDGQDGGGGGRNFDMNEMRQRMMERTREQLEITDDAEWKALEPLITKVSEARMAVGFGRFGGGRGGRGGGPGGGFGEPNPTAEALQKAIDAKASNAETKAALDKFVADRKAKQAALEKAQADLRKVLTPRQEAIATLNGLL